MTSRPRQPRPERLNLRRFAALAGVLIATTWVFFRLFQWRNEQAEIDAHWHALAVAITAAVDRSSRPVYSVGVSRLEERLRRGNYVASGLLYGKPDPVVTRKWPYFAHLTRLCKAPTSQCWRVDAIVADDTTVVYPPEAGSPAAFLQKRFVR